MIFTHYTDKDKYLKGDFGPDIVPSITFGSILRPNMDKVINLDYSSRRLITNERSWRISSPDKGIYQSPIMVAGCSWAEGVHEDWKDTYTSIIEKTFKVDVGNIGVSSYSLLQIMKRIKSEVEIVKPKIIVISYLSGHIERCFKYNAVVDLIHRPIYKISQNKDKKYLVLEPITLSNNTFNYLSLLATSNQNLNLIQKSILYFSRKMMLLLNGHFLNKFITKKYIDPVKNVKVDDAKVRMNTLLLFLSDLDSVCTINNCKVILFGMPDRIGNHEHTRLVHNRDDELINDILAKKTYFNNIRYIQSSELVNKIDAQVSNNMYFGSVWARDNPHPNSAGYRIIGKAIVENMKALLDSRYWNF